MITTFTTNPDVAILSWYWNPRSALSALIKTFQILICFRWSLVRIYQPSFLNSVSCNLAERFRLLSFVRRPTVDAGACQLRGIQVQCGLSYYCNSCCVYPVPLHSNNSIWTYDVPSESTFTSYFFLRLPFL